MLGGRKEESAGEERNAQRLTLNAQRLNPEAKDLNLTKSVLRSDLLHYALDVKRWALGVSLIPHAGRDRANTKIAFPRIEIERALSRITVSRSGSNYQEYGVE
jgi:hypothetical protein